jgi:uridine phosphorylase
MGVPRFASKHDHDEFLSPSRMLEWRRERGMVPDRVPRRLIVLYQDPLFEAARHFESVTRLGDAQVYGRAFTLDRTDGEVAVIGGFGIGAPVATAIVEDFIALGVCEFLSIGTAGGLQPDLEPGDVVIATSAIRDEGVSHHYAPRDVAAEPDAALAATLETAIDAAGLPHRRGTCWTIDTPYRETAAEVRHYQAAGVQCVDMEAAALFTVAAHRGVSIASAFCISDSLWDAEWNPHFDDPTLAHNLLLLFGAAVEAASPIP